MKTLAMVFPILFVCFAAHAQVAAPLDDEQMANLPKFLTEQEKLLPPLPVERDFRDPPSGNVHCPAEYEPCDGLFVAWESYTSLLSDMAYYTTNFDPEAKMYVVVDSVSEQNSAYSSLSGDGVDMTQVEFIVRNTDTVWIRDYGPRFIIEDGNPAVVDHTYNRPRPNDNLLNDYVCTLWGIPQYQIPLTHGGGNFHLFANGDAFMSDLILDENYGMTEQEVIDLYADYQNVNLTIYPGFDSSFDSTQHIDMWMLPVDDYEIIIGEYPDTGYYNPHPYDVTEAAVADLLSRGYTVHRTPGWNSGGTHYTYTNAVVLNSQVYMPQFGGSYSSQDSQALSVFQNAFQGKTIRQLDCGSIIHAAGALHCIVMHVPAFSADPNPQVTVLTPNGGERWYAGDIHNIYWEASDDNGVTSIDILCSTDGGDTWPITIATGETNDGVFPWTVSDDVSTTCRIKVVAYDADLNTGEDQSDGDFEIAVAPTILHNFNMDSDPGWSTSVDWEFGPATYGGTHNRDPEDAHTGTNVYGYNLGGDYASGMTETVYLTTNALNCANATGVELRFWRWLGVEPGVFDQATLEASTDGSNWTTIWQNPGNQAVSDTAWTQCVYDLSTIADNQPTLFLRWGMGPTDGSITYPGWNIDDVEIWGVSTGQPDWCLGDMNCSGGSPDFADILYFAAAVGNEAGWIQYYRDNNAGEDPPCPWLLGDYNGGGVEFTDITPFANSVGQPCITYTP